MRSPLASPHSAVGTAIAPRAPGLGRSWATFASGRRGAACESRIAFNLLRAAGALASRFHATATTGTLRGPADQHSGTDHHIRKTNPTRITRQLALTTRLADTLHRRARRTRSQLTDVHRRKARPRSTRRAGPTGRRNTPVYHGPHRNINGDLSNSCRWIRVS